MDLRYKGRRVPYVTKWSSEDIVGQRFNMLRHSSGFAYLAFDPQSPLDRDRRNVLWYRDGSAQGEGEPMWRSVHTARQRRCMARPLCQVCGKKLPDRQIPWLFSKVEWEALFDPVSMSTTTTPPTCEDCWPDAALLCPHLRRYDTVRAYVEHATPWGVVGNRYYPDGRVSKMLRIPYDMTEAIWLTDAKQAVVQLHNFVLAQ